MARRVHVHETVIGWSWATAGDDGPDSYHFASRLFGGRCEAKRDILDTFDEPLIIHYGKSKCGCIPEVIEESPQENPEHAPY